VQFFDYDDINPREGDTLYHEIRKLDAPSREYILTLIRDMNNRPK